ncbi:MAG: branched-chain amino acid aminotransferase [Proteobacteria bacterium]|nr:branched-chain amino acid aminotransferase [Pseudomonadota bacterium]MBU1139215.1 branched-chain amino acid aminotransferase [Pseudomonadota bacterium]MBU1233952.1 branched-chain amino acid aminotransferase [Pseudomonadota bacterium]MBU1420773.1 branched-chain amino acid aminotransferase [Pseudomonadota bacterium]MBU1456879.1 branched-chain amino acid aminotransferase [Pseudomonadota bacterium]
MWENIEVAVNKCDSDKRKDKPDQNALGFGKHFTDHMFLMKWDRQNGWHDAEICPYRNFNLDPASMVFHYGQAIFEGLKVYKGENDQIYMFRPEDNLERMNTSALRMCMPRLPVEKVLKGLKALVYLDREWIPTNHGATLYVRPTMIAVEPALGVRPSNEYYFFIIMSPVGAYYPEGFSPTKIWVTDKYVRAVKGGVGHVKTAGNYAASIMAAEEAHKAGYTQVLWLDACERKYVEEVGTSNIFFKIGDELITPPLDGSILGGITRDSVIQLARSWGINVVEKQISIDEVIAACSDSSLHEIFASGTAAVISPVGELCYQDKQYIIADGKTGELSRRLFEELQAIQNGKQKDPFKWIVRIG